MLELSKLKKSYDIIDKERKLNYAKTQALRQSNKDTIAKY